MGRKKLGQLHPTIDEIVKASPFRDRIERIRRDREEAKFPEILLAAVRGDNDDHNLNLATINNAIILAFLLGVMHE
jgi:hypothetical protein